MSVPHLSGPSRCRLPDGRTYNVPGPDYANLSPNGRTLIVFTEGGNGVRVLDVALITEIDSNTEH